jgi:CcmD family protein
MESGMSYLYAAYIATWVIHVAYLGTLLRRYIRLRNEIAEFNAREEKQ